MKSGEVLDPTRFPEISFVSTSVEAPAATDAKPLTWTRPDIMFSATPVPALPWTSTVASLFMPAQ